MLAAHRGAAAPPTKKQASDTVAGLRYTTERLARDALAEIQNGMVSGTFVSRSTLTVEQACADWLAGRHSIRPTIRAGYEHALSPLRHRHGDLPVQKLNKGHLDQLVADLMSGRVRRGRAAPQMAADSINPMVNIVSLFWQVTCVGASSWAQYRNPSIAPRGIATVLAAVVTRPDGTLVAAEGVGTRTTPLRSRPATGRHSSTNR